jgi:hypothetical protein
MTRFPTALAAVALALGLAQGASAQPSSTGAAPTAFAANMRGTWSLGECSAPAALLHVTARSVARLPETGTQSLVRFGRFAEREGWTLAFAAGPGQARVLLRLRPDGGLDVADPREKMLDEELPGDSPVSSFTRCASPPPAMTALHGEGLAFAAAMDGIDAACTAGAPGAGHEACVAALMQHADIARDGKLTVAEIARLARGAAWAVMTSEGVAIEELAAGIGAAGLAGIGLGHVMVASYDFDGDGRLSPAELLQDRAPVMGGVPPDPPSGALATPAPLLPPGQMGALRQLLEGLAPWMSGQATR